VLGVVALLAFAGCATTNVLVQAPEEFWMTVEKLLLAMWEDVTTFLLVLGL
jgi:hypothetical protein